MSVADRVAHLERQLRELRTSNLALRRRCERLARMLGRDDEQAAGPASQELARRLCVHCDTPFTPSNGRQRFCSSTHRSEFQSILADARRERHRAARMRGVRSHWAAKFARSA